jgi:hypothetical protein
LKFDLIFFFLTHYTKQTEQIADLVRARRGSGRANVAPLDDRHVAGRRLEACVEHAETGASGSNGKKFQRRVKVRGTLDRLDFCSIQQIGLLSSDLWCPFLE